VSYGSLEIEGLLGKIKIIDQEQGICEINGQQAENYVLLDFDDDKQPMPGDLFCICLYNASNASGDNPSRDIRVGLLLQPLEVHTGEY
jgi:hypothetical protein